MKEDERSVWEALVPVLIHPTKVFALEAMAHIGRPLCANDIVKLVDDKKITGPLANYHLSTLHKAGAIKLSHTQKVRGFEEHFFEIA